MAAGALLLLVATGSDWPGFVAVGAVFVVAVAQHAILASTATRQVRETIRSEDPDAPRQSGEVAAAVRERIRTERRDAEHQNADVRAALSSAQVGVVVTDGSGRVLNTVGATAGLVPTGATPTVEHPILRRMFADVLDSGAPRSELVSMERRNAVMQWTAVPLDRDAVGAVVTDVTEVQRVQAMRRHFVADASHELKTPIAAIQAAAEALQTALGLDEERVRLFARRLEEQAIRLGRIVNDLLDLSRLEADVPEMAPFDLADLLSVEFASIGPEAEAEGIALEREVGPAEIVGNRNDVGLAIRNLLTNAVRYSERGGVVSVVLAAEAGEVVLTVEDSGIGIPASEQDRVFERFYRVDGARSRATGGTGLGLSIVRHVMLNHGGTATVDSTPGVGSTFTLRFPGSH